MITIITGRNNAEPKIPELFAISAHGRSPVSTPSRREISVEQNVRIKALMQKLNVPPEANSYSEVALMVTSLTIASRGDFVELYNPEAALHPASQVVIAEEIVRSAFRGIDLALWTHSPTIFLTIQTFVAEGKLCPSAIELLYVDDTTVDRGTLDRAGAYGDWPGDPGDLDWSLSKRYLDAAEKVLMAK